MRLHFEWDTKKAASNLRKHKVIFAEAVEVFRDPLALTIFDDDHSEGEDRWVTLGQIRDRRLVVVINTWHEENSNYIRVRIISARLATVHELKQYEG